MNEETNVTPISSLAIPRGRKEPSSLIRTVNIRGVPENVWARARQNALASAGMPFREYVIRLLAESQPFPAASRTSRLPSKRS